MKGILDEIIASYLFPVIIGMLIIVAVLVFLTYLLAGRSPLSYKFTYTEITMEPFYMSYVLLNTPELAEEALRSTIVSSFSSADARTYTSKVNSLLENYESYMIVLENEKASLATISTSDMVVACGDKIKGFCTVNRFWNQKLDGCGTGRVWAPEYDKDCKMLSEEARCCLPDDESRISCQTSLGPGSFRLSCQSASGTDSEVCPPGAKIDTFFSEKSQQNLKENCKEDIEKISAGTYIIENAVCCYLNDNVLYKNILGSAYIPLFFKDNTYGKIYITKGGVAE
ncbi:MAG: hypothetical protein J4473_06025 [Candidatus Aenigmarchaeota archaeon]|nr:hypothetical protein [Candidatus Aenigmarchaeota archaeon]